MKKQNGITLIALIITIIVMMILVGVTISVALNGGLFDQARTAARETQKAIYKEELQEAIVVAYNQETGKVDLETLKTALEGKRWTGKVENGEYIFTSPNENGVTYGGKVSENGVITDSPDTSTDTSTFTYGTYYMGGIEKISPMIVEIEENLFRYLGKECDSSSIEIIDNQNAELTMKYLEDGEEKLDVSNVRYFVTKDNVILAPEWNSTPMVKSKTSNDVTFGLSGNYIRESDGLVQLYFSDSTSYVRTYKKESADDEYFTQTSKDTYSYYRVGDKYYFNTGDEFTVSADGKTLTCNGVTYKNESATPIEQKEPLEFITPSNSDFIYGIYYAINAEDGTITTEETMFLKEDSILYGLSVEDKPIDVNEDESTITVALSEEESFVINYIKTENNVILNSEDMEFTVALSDADLLYDLEGDYINSDSSKKITFNGNFANEYSSWNNGTDWYDESSSLYCGYDGKYYFQGEKLEANAAKTTLTASDGTVYTK